MATDLKPLAETIIQQYTDVFFGKYMTEQWGIDAGYSTIPDYYAVMQFELLRWQQGMDCDNELCTASRRMGVTVVSMESGTASIPLSHPCCSDNARFEPL